MRRFSFDKNPGGQYIRPFMFVLRDPGKSLWSKRAIRSLLFGFFWLGISVGGAVQAFGQNGSAAALAAYERKDYAAAVELFKQLAAKNPADPENYSYLGNCYYHLGKFSDALAQYQAALSRKAKHWDALYGSGLTYLKLGQPGEAEQTFKKGTGDRAQKARFFNGLGFALQAQRKLDEADKAFRQAILANPKVAEYHLNLAEVNFDNGIYPIAVDEYRQALVLDATLSEARYRLAQALLKGRDFNGALEQLKEVLRADSTFAPAYFEMGDLYLKNTPPSFKEAIWSLEHYIKLDTTNLSKAYLALAKAYYALRFYDSTMVKAKSVIARDPKNLEAYFTLGQAASEGQKWSEAVEAYKRYQELLTEGKPDYPYSAKDAEFFQKRGEAYVGLKDSTARPLAIADFEKALLLDSSRTQVFAPLGSAYIQSGDYERAIAWYQRALAADSTKFSTWYNIGLAYQQRLRFAEAAEAFRHAVALKPDNVPARSRLAYILTVNLQNYGEGRQAFLEVLKVDSLSADAHLYIGFAYLVEKKAADALPYLERSYHLRVNHQAKSPCDNTDNLLWLAQASALSNRIDEAKKWAKKALECDSKNQPARELLKSLEPR